MIDREQWIRENIFGGQIKDGHVYISEGGLSELLGRFGRAVLEKVVDEELELCQHCLKRNMDDFKFDIPYCTRCISAKQWRSVLRARAREYSPDAPEV